MSHMMKTAALTIALMGIVVCMPQTGLAQDAKIAVVDIQQLTLMCDEGKAVNAKLEQRFQAISAEMEKARKDIEDKETRLRTQDRLMSATAKAQLASDIDNDKRKFDRKNEDYQKEMSDLQNELLGPVAAKVQAELSTFVNEKGYTILIDLSAENGNVVWANPANDVTKEVMVRINEAYKKSGGAATPAAATPSKPPAAPAGQQQRTAPATSAPAAVPRQ